MPPRMAENSGGLARSFTVSLRGRQRFDPQHRGGCNRFVRRDGGLAASHRNPDRLAWLAGWAAVIAIARQLQRESAYDASYVALAQELDAELWTLDGPLARNAAGVDLPVRLIDTNDID